MIDAGTAVVCIAATICRNNIQLDPSADWYGRRNDHWVFDRAACVACHVTNCVFAGGVSGRCCTLPAGGAHLRAALAIAATKEECEERHLSHKLQPLDRAVVRALEVNEKG